MRFRAAFRVVVVIGVVGALAASALATTSWAQAGAPPATTPPHGYVTTKAVPGSDIPADYTFVLTRDEIYVPISVRKPKGNGPFPVITMGSGEGKAGMKQVERLTESLSQMQDRMLARGYVVVTINYRNEVPEAYGQYVPPENVADTTSGGNRTRKSTHTLDHVDLISIIQYLQTLPYVDKDAIGSMGVSHSGEMIMKAAAEYTFGAGVCIEPAVHELLSVDEGRHAPRAGTEIQFQDANVVREFADKNEAMERLLKIKTPIVVFGRDKDHNQGMFRLAYEWLKEAGGDVEWQTFDHPVHGYVFTYNQKDGSYKPDAVQQQAYDVFMAYFDKRLKHAHAGTGRSEAR
jgi:dienelactone hydrolase